VLKDWEVSLRVVVDGFFFILPKIIDWEGLLVTLEIKKKILSKKLVFNLPKIFWRERKVATAIVPQNWIPKLHLLQSSPICVTRCSLCAS